MLSLLLKGISAGALIAFPVGPVGVLCLRRMLSHGALIGIASGLGSATADVIYAAIAFLGISAVYSFLVAHFVFVRIMSSIFFCALGVHILFSSPAVINKASTHNLVQAYLSTLLLTLANPLLILSFIAFFTLVGITGQEGTMLDMIIMISGIFIGSSAWWLVGGLITALMHCSLQPGVMRIVNIISGGLIIGFGIATLCSVLFA